MKEVKIFTLEELAGKSWPTKRKDVVEDNLGKLLNDGWRIEGCGGTELNKSFVILVREN